MRINLVLGSEVDEIIILNVKIWTAKIDLLARVDPFCLDRCPQFLAPEIRTRNVNFISRTARQSRAGQLRYVCGVSLLCLEIGVARTQIEACDWRGAQLGFHALSFRRAEIQRSKLPVETDDIGQIVVKVSRADYDPPLPKSLFNPSVPAEIFFRVQSKIHPENFVLAARRTESGRHARVQRRVGLVDFVTARNPISPNVAELVEMIDPSAAD